MLPRAGSGANFDDVSVTLVPKIIMSGGADIRYECEKLLGPESSHMNSRLLRLLDAANPVRLPDSVAGLGRVILY